METRKICPQCGKAIARVDESDMPVNGTRSDINFDAVCFSCPVCHAILGVGPDVSGIEPAMGHVRSAVGDVHSEVSNLKTAYQRVRAGKRKKK
jgi:uncharacterized protein with PIN domain